MESTFERHYRAVASRDARFDGRFVTAVRTTGVYCRPSCPAQTPRPENVDFYASPAAAVAAGFRACKRCRPDAAPGSPEWNRRSDLAGRALRAIAAGALDDAGVAELARTLAVTERHLRRILLAEVGAGPLALARTRRAQTARLLLEATDLSVSAIAFSAGFSSLRQFNDTMRRHFALTPTEIRARRGVGPAADGRLVLRLAARAPFDGASLLAFLAARAVPGVEDATPERYRRSLPDGTLVTLTAGPDAVRAELSPPDADLTGIGRAVARCRRLLDLDADPVGVASVLGLDPHLCGLLRRRPGLRVPGTVDGFEILARAVVGQHLSLATTRTVLGRLAAAYGAPLPHGDGQLRVVFPTSAELAGADLEACGLTRARARALRAVAEAHATGVLRLEPGADRDEVTATLVSLPGVGPWTAEYVAMRALGDPDAYPAGDLTLRRAVERCGADPERWRPFRAYAAVHIWSAGRSELAPPVHPVVDEALRATAPARIAPVGTGACLSS